MSLNSVDYIQKLRQSFLEQAVLIPKLADSILKSCDSAEYILERFEFIRLFAQANKVETLFPILTLDKGFFDLQGLKKRLSRVAFTEYEIKGKNEKLDLGVGGFNINILVLSPEFSNEITMPPLTGIAYNRAVSRDEFEIRWVLQINDKMGSVMADHMSRKI